MVGQGLRRDGLAVEPLLQVGEGGDAAAAQDQQLTVQGALEGHRRKHVGEGVGDVVAGAGVETAHAALTDRLDADAVPLPFGGVVGGLVAVEVDGLVDRLGQHHGPKAPKSIGARPFALAHQPGEDVGVGRVLAVPDLLQLGDGHAAEVGRRLAGEAPREPDPQSAGEQLEQGPAAVGVEGVEPAFEDVGNLFALGGAQGLDHLGKVGLAVGAGPLGPDQGDGLRQVANIVVGPAEEERIDPGLHRRADHRRLGGVEGKVAGQGRQRPAALGVGRLAQIVAHQGQLGVARAGQAEPVEQVGEGAHQSSSSSS